MGWHTAGLQHVLDDDDVVVASPLTAYSGDTGTLGYVNNLMMYTNTPSQEGSEAFLTAYLDDMKVLLGQQADRVAAGDEVDRRIRTRSSRTPSGSRSSTSGSR